MNDTDMQKVRDGLVANAGRETVDAFDVWRYFESAAAHGMQVEWFETFILEMTNGTPPVQAAWSACQEWDT